MNKLIKTIKDFVSLLQMKKEHILVHMSIGSFFEASIPYINLYFSAQIINMIIKKEYGMCKRYVLIFLSLIAICEVIKKACMQKLNQIKEVSTRNINEKVLRKAYIYDFEKLETDNAIDILRRAKGTLEGIGGVPAAMDSLYRIFSTFFTILFSLFFVIVLFSKTSAYGNFFSSAKSTVAILFLYIVISIVMLILMSKAQNVFNVLVLENDHNNAVGQYVTDIMINQKNGKDIRIYSLKNILNNIYEKYYVNSLGVYLSTGKITGRYYSLIAFLGQVLAGASYILIGAKAIYGVIGIGDIFLYIGAINSLMGSIGVNIGNITGFLYKWNYLKELLEFISMPDKVDGQEDIVNLEKEHVIEFHDVSFKYPNSEAYVLRHINLKIDPGDKIAIVGYNGAGKTTLVKLLCRLYKPTEGTITIDEVDIQTLKYKEYVKIFSAIFQDFKLFSLPLDENIVSGQEPDSEKLWRCIEQVNLRRRVELMGQGLQTQLYNDNGNGVEISGGEAQRFAIARALYKNSGFMIMDEPTAALDPIAEAEIYEQMNEMVKGKTTIFISHRMSSCRFCKKIIVIDQGSIVEQGDHNELVKEDGIYAKLFAVQARYYA